MLKQYIIDLKQEFAGYSGAKLVKDILAGLTVAAVALPLALAFGVSSGADAAAGLITAIIAGAVIGGLSGAFYQISGPTGGDGGDSRCRYLQVSDAGRVRCHLAGGHHASYWRACSNSGGSRRTFPPR